MNITTDFNEKFPNPPNNVFLIFILIIIMLVISFKACGQNLLGFKSSTIVSILEDQNKKIDTLISSTGKFSLYTKDGSTIKFWEISDKGICTKYFIWFTDEISFLNCITNLKDIISYNKLRNVLMINNDIIETYHYKEYWIMVITKSHQKLLIN